jgi:deferrochelatase/peroxidase EfeB
MITAVPSTPSPQPDALERKPSAELADIQRLVFSGFPQYPKALYSLFRITDPQQARAWLEERIDFVARSDADNGREVQLAIAFTYSGLGALGLHETALASFIPEFRQGMTAPHRARVLGDVDDDGRPDTSRWRWGAGNERVDMLCAVFAKEGVNLEELCDPAAYAERGLSLVYHVLGDYDETEHFGFKDGISQPYISGSGKFNRGSEKVRGKFAPRDRVRAGEFILGYKNEFGVLPASPSVRAELGIGPLTTVPLSSDGDLGFNGTFLVARELDQDTELFAALTEQVAACMVGRWKGGEPLVAYPPPVPVSDVPAPLPPRAPDAAAMVDDNDFTYYARDAAGLRCPLGAHIRRANPRDALADPSIGITPEMAIKLANQHRILRRGRNFTRNDGRKGLFFMCLNTNIERQFEFVQQTWINNPKFSGPRDEFDPLISPLKRKGNPFTLRGGPERESRSLSSYVTLRGGAYFFLPSVRALEYLARLGP